MPPSGRTTGGFRLNTEDDIERLLLIKQMKPLVFMLEELRQLLDARDRLHEEPDGTSERERLQEQLRMFSELAEVRCDSLRSQLRAAEAAVEMLHREAQYRRDAKRPKVTRRRTEVDAAHER